jgi:hypothetical protein
MIATGSKCASNVVVYAKVQLGESGEVWREGARPEKYFGGELPGLLLVGGVPSPLNKGLKDTRT